MFIIKYIHFNKKKDLKMFFAFRLADTMGTIKEISSTVNNRYGCRPCGMLVKLYSFYPNNSLTSLLGHFDMITTLYAAGKESVWERVTTCDFH